LVDRHPLMRGAAAQWINAFSRLAVCGWAGSMATAFERVRCLHPDIIVTEIMQPEDLGFIRELHRRYPALPILVFTTREEEVYRWRAKEAGADRYLTKEAGGDKLIQNIVALLYRRREAHLQHE
jgi:DNA-binding NarL/FixJ family response regulator